MTRQEANLEILALIKETVDKYPDLRFSQILDSLGCVQSRSTLEPGWAPCVVTGGEPMPVDPADLLSYAPWINEFYVEPTVILARMKGISR
jgi:hypothetical protein